MQKDLARNVLLPASGRTLHLRTLNASRGMNGFIEQPAMY